MGAVAYKLKLPQGSQVHLVFHVSQMKKALPPAMRVSADLTVFSLSEWTATPEKLSKERLVCKGKKMIATVKVQWTGMPKEFQTWEGLHALHRLYPAAPA